MEDETFDERLILIKESEQKIARLQHKNIFLLDIGSLRLLERLVTALQDILSENRLLKESNRILSMEDRKRRDE
tara:strand:+ start:834 stop:1055 length:222 start_codon:yes stop_codon:yes gene_type:complete